MNPDFSAAGLSFPDWPAALSQLRLDMKYLVFDLEATRRERDALSHNQDDDHLRGEN